MANKGKYYMTTAIAYTSGKHHIGNTYENILADAIARYKRAEGYDVYFQTGTDEHGQKIQEKAAAAGISPKEFVDQISGEVKRIWDMVNSSYDNFVRTTDEDHEKCVRKSSRSFTIRATSTRAHTRDFTVHHVSHSGQSHSSWTENVRTADARYSLQRRRHTSSR